MAPHRKPVFGGQFVPIAFIDGRPSEEVFVKLLSPRLYPEVRRSLQDEARQAEIFTNRDAAFIDLLRPESVERIIDLGWELNRDHINRNALRVLERTGEESLMILEALESIPPEVLKETPELMDKYRDIAAHCLAKALPPNRSPATDYDLVAARMPASARRDQQSNPH